MSEAVNHVGQRESYPAHSASCWLLAGAEVSGDAALLPVSHAQRPHGRSHLHLEQPAHLLLTHYSHPPETQTTGELASRYIQCWCTCKQEYLTRIINTKLRFFFFLPHTERFTLCTFMEGLLHVSTSAQHITPASCFLAPSILLLNDMLQIYTAQILIWMQHTPLDIVLGKSIGLLLLKPLPLSLIRYGCPCDCPVLL